MAAVRLNELALFLLLCVCCLCPTKVGADCDGAGVAGKQLTVSGINSEINGTKYSFWEHYGECAGFDSTGTSCSRSYCEEKSYLNGAYNLEGNTKDGREYFRRWDKRMGTSYLYFDSDCGCTKCTGKHSARWMFSAFKPDITAANGLIGYAVGDRARYSCSARGFHDSTSYTVPGKAVWKLNCAWPSPTATLTITTSCQCKPGYSGSNCEIEPATIATATTVTTATMTTYTSTTPTTSTSSTSSHTSTSTSITTATMTTTIITTTTATTITTTTTTTTATTTTTTPTITTTSTITSLRVNDDCDPRNDRCTVAEGLACDVDVYKCRYFDQMAVVVVPVDPNALSSQTQRFRLYVNQDFTNSTSAMDCVYTHLLDAGISKSMVKTIHPGDGGIQPSLMVAVVTLLNTAPAGTAQRALRYFDHATATQNNTAEKRTATCSITPASPCADGSARGADGGPSCFPCPVGSATNQNTNQNNQCEACPNFLTNAKPCWAIEGWPGTCGELHMAELASEHCDENAIGYNWTTYGVAIITIILTVVGLCYNYSETQKLRQQSIEDRHTNRQQQRDFGANIAATANALTADRANNQLQPPPPPLPPPPPPPPPAQNQGQDQVGQAPPPYGPVQVGQTAAVQLPQPALAPAPAVQPQPAVPQPVHVQGGQAPAAHAPAPAPAVQPQPAVPQPAVGGQNQGQVQVGQAPPPPAPAPVHAAAVQLPQPALAPAPAVQPILQPAVPQPVHVHGGQAPAAHALAPAPAVQPQPAVPPQVHVQGGQAPAAHAPAPAAPVQWNPLFQLAQANGAAPAVDNSSTA